MINCINYSSQFWTWLAARRRCNPAARRAEFRNAPLMEAVVRFTRHKPAPWRGPNVDHGGMWTCWNRIWFSWCDWTSVNRVAVSNIVYFSALRCLREFTVLCNKRLFANYRKYFSTPSSYLISIFSMLI